MKLIFLLFSLFIANLGLAAESLYKFDENDFNALEERIKSKGCGEIIDNCAEVYTENCVESSVDRVEECIEELIVHVQKGRDIQKSITIYYSKSGEGNHDLLVDLKIGELVGSKSNIKVSPLISEIPECGSIKVSLDSYQLWDNPFLKGAFDHDAMPELRGRVQCNDGIKVPIHISGRSDRINKGLVINLSVNFQTKTVIRDEWRGDCEIKKIRFEKLGCTINQVALCHKNKSTRDIFGEKIIRNCWERVSTFNCPQFKTGERCAELKSKGCEQVDSKCIDHDDQHQCLQYQQTFSCSKKNCPIVSYKDCNDDMDFMGKNYSQETVPENAEEFQRALTSFSAVINSASSFDGQQVFRGEPLHCRKDGFSYNNCCKEKGWGSLVGLAGCNKKEKRMAKAMEENRCVHFGSYCDKKILSQCVRHKESACCFGSPLAKIIQEHSHKQFNLSWGNKKHPDCSGLSPEKLQEIDFSKLDTHQILIGAYQMNTSRLKIT